MKTLLLLGMTIGTNTKRLGIDNPWSQEWQTYYPDTEIGAPEFDDTPIAPEEKPKTHSSEEIMQHFIEPDLESYVDQHTRE